MRRGAGADGRPGLTSRKARCTMRRLIPGLALSWLLVMATYHAGSARTWIVDLSGGGDFTKIADACEAAQSGDTVALHPGEYDEYGGPFAGGIWIPDKALSLIGLARKSHHRE